MDSTGVESGSAEGGQDLGEIDAEVFVRAGWSAKFRGVRIARAGADGATYSIVPLPESADDVDWQPVTFATNASQIRILLPNSVRITNKSGQVPEIERRPTNPGGQGRGA
jgi:hypothetical protein